MMEGFMKWLFEIHHLLSNRRKAKSAAGIRFHTNELGFQDNEFSERRAVLHCSRFVAEPLEGRVLLSGITTLAAFDGTDGSGPAGLILSGNTQYGVALGGGAHGDGEVFSLPIAGGTPTVLASFDGTDGIAAAGDGQGELILSGNTLYGAAEGPGGNGGEVFSVPITGGAPTVLASFTVGGLLLSGSTFYGVEGGSSFEVVSLPITGGTPTVLASFDGTGLTTIYGGLLLSGSTLYGMANGGGASGAGAIFSVPITGGTPTVLASFNGTDGVGPWGGLILSGNTLYGGTQAGGAYLSSGGGGGAVFSLPVAGGAITALTSFTGNYADPDNGLTLSGDTLYGTVSGIGADSGALFSIPVTGGAPSLLASFDSPGGEAPDSQLILSGGNLYGTAAQGGTYGHGTVFEYTLPSSMLIAPTGVTASQGTPPHHVALSWAAVAGATSYQVFRSIDNNFSDAIKIAGGITTDSYNDATTIPGTLYYYWVCARNSQMIGPASTAASGYIPLAAPTGVAATTNLAHHVAVTWNPVAGATTYQIFRSTTDDFSTAVRIATGLTATFFNDTTAVLGDTYFYWVRAKNGVSVGLTNSAVMGSLE
jgi:uncharacterized repeat protein (TIGR03803 family)